MERLTFYENGKAHFSIGYSDYSGKVADKLASYEDAEEQGLLVRLPCKVGDTVYILGYYGGNNEMDVATLNASKLSTIARWVEAGAIGKTIFLTREEAEAALKEG